MRPRHSGRTRADEAPAPDRRLVGRSVRDRLGRGVAGAGDVDGDGRADLLASFSGTWEFDGQPGAIVFSGATGRPLRVYLAGPGPDRALPLSSEVDLDLDGRLEHVLEVEVPRDPRTEHRTLFFSAAQGEALLEVTGGEHPAHPIGRRRRDGGSKPALVMGITRRRDGTASPVLVELE